MNPYEWLQTIIFFVVLLALVKPLGSFMAKASNTTKKMIVCSHS